MTDPLAPIKAALLHVIDWKEGGYSGPAYANADARRELCRRDPLAFAYVYLSGHLRNVDGDITLAEVHLGWVEAAKEWIEPADAPQQHRRVEVAPREMGKSTWWFLILPMWAAAYGHSGFVAAFAHTSTQAETHLASFKSELENNDLLRADFPELVTPKTRGRGTVAADRVSLYHAASGFVFAAAGMDSANLGMKVGSKRPDILILDDIEPEEAKYSSDLAKKRLGTLRDAILPLNVYARVTLVGTVTMTDSIIHQLVQAQRLVDSGKPLRKELLWTREERFETHHHLPVIEDEHGRRSAWPAKWPLAFLDSIKHTRTFAKNYANDPIGADGDYWTMEHFERDLEGLDHVTRILISVDPAVTTKASSDYTGVSAIGWAPGWNPNGGTAGTCFVLEAVRVKLGPDPLRAFVLDMVQRVNAGLVLVEVNQGGELWERVFRGLPVKVKTITQSVKKEVRAATVLTYYERHRVKHAAGLDLLEGEMVGFPNAANDDMVDATGSGIDYFLKPRKRAGGVGGTTESYA